MQRVATKSAGRALRVLGLSVLAHLPSIAHAQSTVALVIERRNASEAEGVATLAAPGALVTGLALLSPGDRWFVTNAQSGARMLGEKLAEVAAETEQQFERKRRQQAELREVMERQREEAQREVETRDSALERQLLVAGAIALPVIAVAFVLLRRRKGALESQGGELSAAESRLAAETKTFPDVLLAGRFPDGSTARLKINGNALARAPDGLVLGRHPEIVDLVLNHPEISREHLRIRLAENKLYITDLQSSNGTQINSAYLEPGVAFEVSHDDILGIGDTEVQLKIMDEANANA